MCVWWVVVDNKYSDRLLLSYNLALAKPIKSVKLVTVRCQFLEIVQLGQSYSFEILQRVNTHKKNKIWGEKKFGVPPQLPWELNGASMRTEQLLEQF